MITKFYLTQSKWYLSFV